MHAITIVFSIFLVQDSASRPFSFSKPHMGTRFEIICYAADDSSANRAANAAFARIAELERIMSDYKPDSELMRLCMKAGGAPVPISDDLFSVLTHAQEVAHRSNGAFDVTIGPVSRLWRRARKIHELPNAAELAAAQSLVGYENLVLDPANRTAKLAKPGMTLDLGGIGKGFAADEALAILKKHGISRALIAAGGDIVCGDPPPDAAGWKVGIARVDDAEKKPERFVLLANAAVSTSGDVYQHLEANGKRHSHVIDPRSGNALTAPTNVTVVAPRGRLADPLTKAAIVLGPAKGQSLVESTRGASVLFVTMGDGQPKVAASAGFPKIHEMVRGD
jgi:thiamine biosynthesis lipoprotein